MRASAYGHLDLAHKAQMAGQAFGCPSSDERPALRGMQRSVSALLWASGGFLLIVLLLAT